MPCVVVGANIAQNKTSRGSPHEICPFMRSAHATLVASTDDAIYFNDDERMVPVAVRRLERDAPGRTSRAAMNIIEPQGKGLAGVWTTLSTALLGSRVQEPLVPSGRLTRNRVL